MTRTTIHDKDLLLPAILVLGMFSLVLCFLTPVINADDDVFLMYQLSGGFGAEPGNLLHYDHIIHPWLGFILAGLFRQLPGINWYSWFLILVQFISWAMLGRCLLQIFGRSKAVFLLILLFVLAGVSGLQSLNLSSTTWVFSLAIMSWLICFPNSVFICFFLFLIAGSIRLQIPLIVVGLFLPLQWIRKDQPFWKPVLYLLLLLLSLFLLNLTHKRYYKKHIPNWESSENKRQDLFYYFNHPKDLQKPDSLIYKDPAEKAFFERLFLFDPHFPSAQRLKEIARASIRFRDLSQQDDHEALYWTWKAWRLYLFYVLIALFIAWNAGELGSLVKKAWFPFAGLFIFYGFLFVFFKFTEAFFMGILLMMALQLCLLWPVDGKTSMKWPHPGWLFLLPMAWSLSRELAQDRTDQAGLKQFRCGARELADHRQNLFLAIGDALPVKYFYFNDIPTAYSLANYIYKERIITFSWQESFNRFGLTGDLQKDLHHPAVLLAGPFFPELTGWLGKKGDSLLFSSKDERFHCIEIRKRSVK